MAEETKTTQAPGAEQAGKETPNPKDTQATESGAGAAAGTETEEKQFTQSDIDAAVEKRLARERRKWERETSKVPTAETQPGAAGAQDDAGAKESAAKAAKASGRELAKDARLAALELGVPAARAEYAARLADLSGVDVDDEDGPDHEAVKKAVQKVLTDLPELKPEAPAQQQPGLKIGADNTSRTTQAGTPAQQAARIKPWNKFRV